MIAELSSARPPVLSDEAWKKLDQYRGFRHVVRNVHAFELDPEQIDLLMKRLPNAAEQAFGDLRAVGQPVDIVVITREDLEKYADSHALIIKS